ncbi:uncharacterized protein IL334_002666 [Kwoniella shivajii]|uniref:Clathrin/coatomer adaptor adaptin-like N-terminal domain-containing protein n=1 Tax=Kwoniella shivajii TaxID=564305 RepID=A0ABZ1CVE5_9TREE|nr:hypothetical protein IL334_002666 [Kwoniella shivajii]
MAALNRLSQRIIENFQETTRDLSLLTGSSPSTTPYDLSDDRVKEISKLLDSRIERERLEGMKRIIAGISKGRDMENFFAQVVKNVVSQSIEIRKLVYIYLLRFASTNSDLLLLSINTFQKDLSDPSPLIRSMSLRVLTSIRVPVIQGIVMLGLKKLVTDRNPWVRKTVAGGLAKVYEMDPSSLSQLIPLLQTLLSSPSPLTLGASLTAFTEICPDRLDLLHPYYRHIIKLLVDADEWGQSVALGVLTRYARVMLEQPPNSGPSNPNIIPKEENGQPQTRTGTGTATTTTKTQNEESEDEFSGIDEDLAMFLHFIKPLFQSCNSAVILATSNAYYHLAPCSHKIIGQELLVKPLIRLAGGSSNNSKLGKEEIGSLTWDILASMAEERPWLFTKYHSSFFVHTSESIFIQKAKLRALVAVTNDDNAQVSIREFKHYVKFPDTAIAEEAVKALGHIVRNQPDVAATGLRSLMRLLKSQRDTLVAQAVIVLKSVILSSSITSSSTIPSPQTLVAKLAKQLDGITNPKARASVYWLVGQFSACDPNSESEKKGLGWQGVELWVPDILRKGIKGFVNESEQAKLQILTLASKLLVISPSSSQSNLFSTYLFSLARYDQDYDIRDRARFLYALLRGIRDEKVSINSGDEQKQEESDEGGEEDRGGVVLRREQIKVVILGKREINDLTEKGQRNDFQVGTMSRITGKKLGGYEEVPEWTDDPTDSSLRDSEYESVQPPTPLSVPTPTYPIPPMSTSISRQTASPNGSSPVGSYPQPNAGIAPSGVGTANASAPKGKFRDLDAFLNSESESEEEEEEEDESDSDHQVHAPMAVTAPPRSAIVPEYDESTSESEDDSSENDNESDSEDDEKAALYR